eukprot:gene9199-7461_t
MSPLPKEDRPLRRTVSIVATNLRSFHAVLRRVPPVIAREVLQRVLEVVVDRASEDGIVGSIAGDRANLVWNGSRQCAQHALAAARGCTHT